MSPWRQSLKCAAQNFQRARSGSRHPIAGCSSDFLKSFAADPSNDETGHPDSHALCVKDGSHGLRTGSMRDWDKQKIQGQAFLPRHGLLSANRTRFTHLAAYPAHIMPLSTTGLHSQALRSFSSGGGWHSITGLVSTSHCADSSASTGPPPAVLSSMSDLSSPSSATVLSDGGVSEITAATAESSAPIAIVQQLIDQLHIATGLPWWLSIVTTTVIIRTVLLPVFIYQIQATARLVAIRPEMERLLERVKAANYEPSQLTTYNQRLQQLLKDNKTSPFAPLMGVFVQAPIFISFYFAISGLAQHVPSFKEGGFGPFLDLSTPDPTYILPLLSSAGILASVELGVAEGMEAQKNAQQMKWMMRVMAVGMVPLSATFPKAVFFYWITANAYTLVQGMVLRRPSVRAALGFPPSLTTPPPTMSLTGTGTSNSNSSSGSAKTHVSSNPSPSSSQDSPFSFDSLFGGGEAGKKPLIHGRPGAGLDGGAVNEIFKPPQPAVTTESNKPHTNYHQRRDSSKGHGKKRKR